jgi:NAD+ diphosphatase
VTHWALASDLDRVDHHRRSTEWIANLWRASDAKLLKLDAQSRFTTNVGGSKLRMTKPFVAFDSQRHRLLGLLEGTPIFAVEALTEGEVHDFREVGFQLSDNERDIAVTAAALCNWHRNEPRCSTCGGPTTVIHGGFARHCAVCDRDVFPRTDPAVIVAVVDDADRLLLGSQPNWGNRVSILAGFVETGESLEQAIHREIAEEVDIALDDVRYVGSQPWPFPRSLMTGFVARATSTNISLDAEEISYAEWFTRDQLNARLNSGELALPGRSSIARELIDRWLAGDLRI